MTALRGVLSFYHGQTQAEGYPEGSGQGRRFYERKVAVRGVL